MDENLSESIGVLVEHRVSESLSKLLEVSPSYKDLSLWAANDSQKLLDMSVIHADDEITNLLKEYFKLMLKVHTLENHYVYMLGLKDWKEIERAIGDSTWSIEYIVELIANDYEPPHESYTNNLSHIRKKPVRSLHKPKRIFATALAAITTVAFFTSLYSLARVLQQKYRKTKKRAA